jgi:hypothetical protein
MFIVFLSSLSLMISKKAAAAKSRREAGAGRALRRGAFSQGIPE